MRELIGTRDGQNYYVGTDTPTPPPTPAPAPAPITRYTTPAPAVPTPTTNTVADYTIQTPEQFSASRTGTVDEAAIREATRKNMQAQVDATEKYYADLVSKENQAGDARLSKVNALNVNSGLSGSNFATSADLTQRDKNSSAVNAIQNEKNLRLQEIYGQIDKTAKEEIAAKKAEALGNADAYSTYLEKARGQASSALQQLASGGIDINQLDPARRSYLFKSAGYDDQLGALIYNSLKPKAAQLDYKYIQQADGSTLALAPDPQNPGQFIEHTIKGASPDIGLVIEMIKKYPDAGITPTDDITTASTKIKNSGIYRDQIRPPVSAGGGSAPTGDNPQLYSGLSSSTATAVRAQVNSFKTEPLVQNFATIQDGYNFAKSIPNNTQNPADDQALIYSLAKTLDPSSVVREGEYATAQKYSQSWINAYGKGIEQAINGTGFLSEQARKNIKATIESRYKASKVTYDNLSKQYSSGIGSLTGRGDGEKFLRNYSTDNTGASEQNLTDEQAYQLYLKTQGAK